MAMLGFCDYLCEACGRFDTDGALYVEVGQIAAKHGACITEVL